MSAIRTSLQRLTAALGNLETSVDQLETSVTGVQRDMFATGPSNENGAKASGSENKKVIADRLDNAIEKVEKLLAQDASA